MTVTRLMLSAAVALILASALSSAEPVNKEQPPKAPKRAVGWRADSSGRFETATPLLEWDGESKKNVLWSKKVGASNFSSVTLVDGKIFLMADPAELVCLDAGSGEVLWRKASTFADLPAKTEETPAAGEAGNTSATPVSDGQCVYVAFGNGLATCHDMAGNRKWIIHFPDECPNEHGRSFSPALVGDKVLFSYGCLRAVDAKTGKELWKNPKVTETYGTPVAITVGGEDVVIAPSGYFVRAADGTILAEGTPLSYVSALVNNATVYFVDRTSAAYQLPDKIVADRLELKKLWEVDLEGTFYSSALFDNDLLYITSNAGKLYALDAKTGTTVWEKEVELANDSGRPGAPNGNVYPSACLAGKNIFIGDDNGNIFVLKPGKEYAEVSRNKLPEGSGGTPVFAGGRMYMRSGENLFCIGAK